MNGAHFKQLLFILFLLVSIPLTLFFISKKQIIRQNAATSNCQNSENIVQNCTFEIVTNGFPSFWVDNTLSPRRPPTESEQKKQKLTMIQTQENGNSIQIGEENGACNIDPNDPIDQIKAATRTDMYVGNANRFTLSFDFKMKSKHTIPGYSPFFVFAGFEPQKNGVTGGGKEIFLAYTPHNDYNPPYSQYCTKPFQSQYTCEANDSGSLFDCSDAFTSWKHISLEFTRQDLCDTSSCITENDTLYLVFGVENDIDTLATIDNISLIPNTTTAPFPTVTSSVVPTVPPILSPTLPSSPQITVTLMLPYANASSKQAQIDLFSLPNTKELSISVQFQKIQNRYSATIPIPDQLVGKTLYSKISLSGYLQKTSSELFTIEKNQPITLSPLTLRLGDVNNDNLISFTDFQLLTSCFTKCTKPQQVDFNDDGIINILDYSIFQENYSKRTGD